MLTIEKVSVFSCKCDKCSYEWQSFTQPKRCAKCKAPGWNKNGSQAIIEHTPIVEREPIKMSAPLPDPEKFAPAEDNVRAFNRPDPRAAKTKKPWKEVKAPAGKKKLCPHGFAVVSGATACTRCN